MRKISLKLYKDEVNWTAYHDYKNNPHAVIHNEGKEDEYLEFHTVEIQNKENTDKSEETCMKNYILDLIFNEKPENESDWDDFMNADENDEVDGFVPCETYGLDNALAIRGVMQAKLDEYLELQSKLKDPKKLKTTKVAIIYDDMLIPETKKILLSDYADFVPAGMPDEWTLIFNTSTLGQIAEDGKDNSHNREALQEIEKLYHALTEEEIYAMQLCSRGGAL